MLQSLHLKGLRFLSAHAIKKESALLRNFDNSGVIEQRPTSEFNFVRLMPTHPIEILNIYFCACCD